MSSFNATSNKIQDISIPFRLKIRYEQVISSDMQLNTSGISEYISRLQWRRCRDIRKKALFGKDLGLGFDLGLTYYLKEYSVYSQYS
jgi:hypothetical protein